MDDWEKFNHSYEKQTKGPQAAPNSGPQTYVNYSEGSSAGNAYAAQPKYVTRKMLVISLIICMLLSAFVGAMAYALAMSTFGGATDRKSVV